MPLAYPSTLYYEDQKKLHDFYLNLGSQRQIAEEQRRVAEEKKQALRQAELEKQLLQGYKALVQLELEEQELQRQVKILDEAKEVLEKERKLKNALWEFNYIKDKQLVIFPGKKISWRDTLSPEDEAIYRERLRRDLGSDKIDVVNKIS